MKSGHQSVEKMKTIKKSQVCKTNLREITAQTAKLYGRECQRSVYSVYGGAIWN